MHLSLFHISSFGSYTQCATRKESAVRQFCLCRHTLRHANNEKKLDYNNLFRWSFIIIIVIFGHQRLNLIEIIEADRGN